MIIATIRLTIMTVPDTISPTKRIIENRRIGPEPVISELSQRSSNSNSPRTITNVFSKDLQTLLKESASLPKQMMKKANAKEETRGPPH